tara:strand:- start:933 stop:1142 length:210 start_codon:yes stop_codon:yes gene_type:complete
MENNKYLVTDLDSMMFNELCILNNIDEYGIYELVTMCGKLGYFEESQIELQPYESSFPRFGNIWRSDAK